MKNKEPQVHVTTFLIFTGSDANRVFETFEWTNENHKSDIVQVLDKFEVYTKPRTNVSLERYRFNLRQQEPNESFEKYVTALRQLASKFHFDAVTQEKLLRDRILFGIHIITMFKEDIGHLPSRVDFSQTTKGS